MCSPSNQTGINHAYANIMRVKCWPKSIDISTLSWPNTHTHAHTFTYTQTHLGHKLLTLGLGKEWQGAQLIYGTDRASQIKARV